MMPPLIHVQWLDAYTQTGWTSLDSKPERNSLTDSIGWLVYASKETLILAGTFDEETQHYNNFISIPVSCIKKRKNIKT